MLVKYKRRGLVAVAIQIAAWPALLLFASIAGGNIWGANSASSIAAIIADITITISWFYILWAFARAKGHNGLWMLVGWFFLLGLLVIALLPDKHKIEAQDMRASEA
jgi:hypothetical protein